MKKIGFSLSGGGLSSIAYVGFFEELKENNIEPKYLAGLSGGALVAVLLASDLTTDEIVDLFSSVNAKDVLNLSWHHLELLDHNKFIELLRNKLPINDFKKLKTPVMVFATDLSDNKPEIIETGDIASAIVASSSIFPALQPVKRKGKKLIDGGYTVYYGAQFFKERKVNKVVGVDVSGLTEGSLKGFLKYFYSPQNASISSNARYELREYPVDLDIQINFSSPTIFNFKKKIPHLLATGRRAAKNNLKAIKELTK